MVSRPCYHGLIRISYLDLRRYISSVRSSVYNNVCLVLQYAFLLVTIGRIGFGKITSEYRAWCAKSKLFLTAEISWIIPILLLLFSISGEKHVIGLRVLSVFLVCHSRIHITVIDMQTQSQSKTNKMQASFTLPASGMAVMATGSQGADKQVFRNSHKSAAISTSTFSSIDNVLKVTQASTTRNVPTPAISKLSAVTHNNPTNAMSRIDDAVNGSKNKVNINYAVFGASVATTNNSRNQPKQQRRPGSTLRWTAHNDSKQEKTGRNVQASVNMTDHRTVPVVASGIVPTASTVAIP
jgi:hypothetical protein